MSSPVYAPVHQDADGDLTDYWRQLNQEIARIEARYPFIVTTVVTALIGLLAAKNTTWFQALADYAPYVVPVLVLLGLAYILSLFRRVAVLRGYSAFVEDEINKDRSTQVYLWNSRYIDRFEQNNSPNILMMVLNLILVGTTIWAASVILANEGLWPWVMQPQNLVFYAVMLALLLAIIFAFASNDAVRKRSYRFAMLENHPDEAPDVCIYPGTKSTFDRSDIGRARLNHWLAAESVGFNVTVNRSDPYHILHVSTWDTGALLSILRARRRGKRIVVSAHSSRSDMQGSIVFSKILAPLFGWWIRALYSRADHILAPSEYAKRCLIKSGITVPITVVSGGVDTSVFKPSTVDRRTAFTHTRLAGLGPSDRVVLGVGFTFQRNGFIDFVDVARQMGDYTFVWCGPILRVLAGPKMLMSILGKPKNVLLAGYVAPATKLAAVMNNADALLGLAYEGSEGLAALEAIACGLPTVIRALPAYPDEYSGSFGIKRVDRDADISEIVTALRSELDTKKTPDKQRVLAELANHRSISAVGEVLKQVYQDTKPTAARKPESE